MKSSVPRLAHHLPSDTPRLRRCSASFGHGSPQKPCCCAEAAAIYVSTVFTKLIYPSYTLHIIAIFRSYYSSAFSYLPARPRLAPSAPMIRAVERCTDSASPTKSRSPLHIPNSRRLVSSTSVWNAVDSVSWSRWLFHVKSKNGILFVWYQCKSNGRTGIENNFVIKNI